MAAGETSPLLVLVRGIGDVASAVAHRLFLEGHAVAIHDGPTPPTAHRRGMAFADAAFDGTAELEGVTARLVDDPGVLTHAARRHAFLPVARGHAGPCLAAAAWDVLVDARMRKRARPEPQCGLARLVIGLGPGFVAGDNVDLAVETAWGDRLGALVEAGPTLPLAGEPRPIGGVGRERLAYAPAEGIWRTHLRIGDPVAADQVVGNVAAVPVAASLGGVLRGLTRDGVPVARGTKIVEVDPRGAERALLRGLGEQRRRIAGGVVLAVSRLAVA